MPMAGYEKIAFEAQSAFLQRVRKARTQHEALTIAADVAQDYAGLVAVSADRALALLTETPSLFHRRLPDGERYDCETICDVVSAYLEHDLTRELEKLVPSSLPKGGN